MELATWIGYLLALAVPLWLLVEGIMVSQSSPKQPSRRVERSRLSGRRAPHASTAAPGPSALRIAESRKTA